MARKPNYRFDRMERDRAKAAKRLERQKSREERAAAGRTEPASDSPEPEQDDSQST